MEHTRYTIILVDDNKANLTMGREMLKTFYKIYPAPSAAKMFEICQSHLPDLILLDIDMPEMNGYEAIRKLKADPSLANIPVIFLTAKSDDESELEGLELGAVDYISKPFSGPLLLKRVANQLLITRQNKELLANHAALKAYTGNLEETVQNKADKVIAMQNALIATVADLVECRDENTGGHIARTQRYLEALTTELIREKLYAKEIAHWDIEHFLSSAPLHDVGKIAITDLILNKPGRLTPEEFEIMKTHVTVGVDAIERIIDNMGENAFLLHTLYIAGTHHEKWDGTGYPMGLKGENIPLEGQLMAIADVYDALISIRPYKKAFSHEEACKIIKDGAGSHFNPALVGIFSEVEGEFAKIAQEIRA
jgi:putative two-component system response regulator